jgi:nucleoside-diphosphate-sugar epimerase
VAHLSPGATVAVTGSAGYIGGWVVRDLLDRGYRVRACVRNPGDAARVGFLRSLPGFASGRLTLHAADLDTPGCFDSPFAGCDGVIHLSHVSTYDDPDYVRGVCEHIISSVQQSGSVRRVVVTSSIAAVIAEADIQELVRRPVIDEDRTPDEDNPKRTPDRGLGYSIGKNIAQHVFADAADRNGDWDAITCCPGDNIGPILSAHHATAAWQGLIAGMLGGSYTQTAAYRPWMPVDVRDDAACHVGLLESPLVGNGERFLAWSAERRNAEDICADIDRLLPELRHDAPSISDPFPDRVRARETELRSIWAGCELRNDRIRAVAPITFRPMDTSIRDCVESLISVAGVPVRRRSPNV